MQSSESTGPAIREASGAAPLQGTWEVVIEARLSDVWAVLDDSSHLPKWCSFMVKETTGGKEGLGATRRCALDSGGRRGIVEERCVEYEPCRRIMWTMDHDTLGITRLLRGFTFGFSLEAEEEGRTRVTFEQSWRARTLIAAVLVPLLMRRQMSSANERLLRDLKKYVERRDGTRSAVRE